jgi:hypothetical protein
VVILRSRSGRARKKPPIPGGFLSPLSTPHSPLLQCIFELSKLSLAQRQLHLFEQFGLRLFVLLAKPGVKRLENRVGLCSLAVRKIQRLRCLFPLPEAEMKSGES